MAKKKTKRKPKKDKSEFDNMIAEFEKAMDADSAMVCIFTMNGNQVRLFRKTMGDPGFPTDDFSTAVDMLDEDLRKERSKVEDEGEDMERSPVLARKVT